MKKPFINFLPPSMTPPARTPTMIRHDRLKQDAQAPYLEAMLVFYVGLFFTFLAVALFLI